MKKIILLFFALLLTSAIFAQSSDPQQDTAKLTKEVLYEDVKAVVKQIADALKVGTEHVYSILVKQQIVKSIVWLIVGAIPTLLLIVFGKSVWTWARDNSKESDGFSGFVAFLFYMFTIVPMIIFMFHLDVIVTGFVNPEYGAITQIMNMIK